jgi:hypothetical protein
MMRVWRRKKGVGIEPAVWVAVRVLARRKRWREPGHGRVPMPLLECRRRRRRQARRRRDTTLGPEDTGAVRRAISCSRRCSCFLQPHCRSPLALALVHNSPPSDICRPRRVQHPLGPLFPRPRLLRRRGEGVTVVASWEDEFSRRHRGGVVRLERRRRCVWRLDRGEMVGECGWIGRKMREN